MRRHLHFIAPYVLLAMAVACLVLAMPGCAAMTPKRAVNEIAITYHDLHQDYERVYATAPPDIQQMMRQEIAPQMNRAWRLIDQGLTVATAGGDVPRERLDMLEQLLSEIALSIVRIAYAHQEAGHE